MAQGSIDRRRMLAVAGGVIAGFGVPRLSRAMAAAVPPFADIRVTNDAWIDTSQGNVHQGEKFVLKQNLGCLRFFNNANPVRHGLLFFDVAAEISASRARGFTKAEILITSRNPLNLDGYDPLCQSVQTPTPTGVEYPVHLWKLSKKWNPTTVTFDEIRGAHHEIVEAIAKGDFSASVGNGYLYIKSTAGPDTGSQQAIGLDLAVFNQWITAPATNCGLLMSLDSKTAPAGVSYYSGQNGPAGPVLRYYY